MDTILVFTGGERNDPDIVSDLPLPDQVIAADSGYDHALDLGFAVDVLVGDMDSVSTRDAPAGVVVERHPADKDQTDLELALELAARESPARVVVVGGVGLRHDHELATAMLLASPRWSQIEEVDWVSQRSRVHVVWNRRILHADVGSVLSVVPVGGDALGVTTKGLRWELKGDVLPHGSTRGVSNIVTGPIVEVRVEIGCVLVVVPRDQP